MVQNAVQRGSMYFLYFEVLYVNHCQSNLPSTQDTCLHHVSPMGDLSEGVSYQRAPCPSHLAAFAAFATRGSNPMTRAEAAKKRWCLEVFGRLSWTHDQRMHACTNSQT